MQQVVEIPCGAINLHKDVSVELDIVDESEMESTRGLDGAGPLDIHQEPRPGYSNTMYWCRFSTRRWRLHGSAGICLGNTLALTAR